MHILFLSQLLPYPPDAGAKVRSYLVLKHLAKQHQVTLVAFARPDDSPQAVAELEKICQAVHLVPLKRGRSKDIAALLKSLVSNRSFIIQRDAVPAMFRKVEELASSGMFDAVHCDQLWMAQYGLRAAPSAAPGKTLIKILDEHNACYLIFKRLAASEKNLLKRAFLEREWRALARYEGQACGRFNRVVTVTQEDRVLLETLTARHSGKNGSATSTQFDTIPICIDARSAPAVIPNGRASEVLHLGTMFFLPNVHGVVWFAQEVWPRVLRQVPDAELTIIGKNPPPEVKKLSGPVRPVHSASNGHKPFIQVTGYVENPRPYLEKAAVFIVPLHSGGGMRVKILDAWRWGLPIVSTSIGAEGIRYQDGENILIADGAEEFAQAIIRVLCDPELARRLRKNGRQWVETHYDWHEVYQAWDQIYAS